MEDNLVVLFCIVDEFCKEFYPEYEKTLIAQGIKRRRRPSRIAPSEIKSALLFKRSAELVAGAKWKKVLYLVIASRMLFMRRGNP